MTLASLSDTDHAALKEAFDQFAAGGDDATLAGAVRTAQARLEAAGLTWHDLLATAMMTDAPEPEDLAAPNAPAGPLTTEEMAEIDGLIDRLLKECKLSADSRSELEDFKQDIASSELSPMDARYVRSLSTRLLGK